MERAILHSDLNNFFASVECVRDPSLAGRPIAVAGDTEKRHGIVLAKNDLAKRCGVVTGEPLWSAERKCRGILFVPPHYSQYVAYSRAVRDIYLSYTDQVEPFSLDECWLDVTASRPLFGSGRTVADDLRARIRRELGLTVSIGVSFNKIFAKLGSDMKKPDATTVIDSAHVGELVHPLGVGELLFAGPATVARLKKYSINTIGDLAHTDKNFLKSLLGKNGETLWTYANGLDASPVRRHGDKPQVKSVGNGMTFPRDLTGEDEIKISLYLLCECVSARLREQQLNCRTVKLAVRGSDLRWSEHQGRLMLPGRTSKALFERARALLAAYPPSQPIRSLSVRAADLSPSGDEQFCFFEEYAALRRQEELETVIDDIRGRFGRFAIQRGISLTDTSLSGANIRRVRPAAPENVR